MIYRSHLAAIGVTALLVAAAPVAAATFTADFAAENIQDVDNAAGIAGTFDFGGAIAGTVTSAVMTSTPCTFGGGCNDTLGTAEFFVFDFSGDIQETDVAVLPLGSTFDTAFMLAGATISDLADGLLDFTLGCDNTNAVGACTGVASARFTLTIETDMAPIPVPASLPLLLAGLAGVGAVSRRRK